MTNHPLPPGQWLERPPQSAVEAPNHLWGFGALHGGLVLAALTRSSERETNDHGRLRSVTGRFHNAITGPFITTPVSRQRPGRFTIDAVERESGMLLASASLVTGRSRAASLTVVAPRCGSVPPPEDCEPYAIPVEFVPISAFMEIRPIGPNRPYAGCDEAELLAWLRLTEDDRAPDLHRMILLLDALAPSYSAVLTSPRPVPTIELTVRPAAGLDEAASPWILLHAQTLMASSDGWLYERINAWDRNGDHLASADQLRVIAGPRGDVLARDDERQPKR